MAAGQIDMVGASYVAFVEAQENWVDEAEAHPGYISPAYQRMAANLDVFAEGSDLDQDFQGLFVPNGSSIKSISQLRGQTIAIDATGGVGYVTIASALLAAGIQPNQVKWAVMPFQDMTSRLLSGKVTAAYLPEPYNSFDEEKYAFTALSDLDVGLTANFPMQGYAVNKEWAQKYPNTLTAFYRALEQGQEIADTNRQIAEQATAEFISGITPSVAAILTMETYPVGPVDPSRLQRVADDMQLVRLSSTSGIYNIQQIIGDNG
jgi:NitT/TauT family transport system substrate-binding protein